MNILFFSFEWGYPPLWPCDSGAFQKLSFTVTVSAVCDFFFHGTFLNFYLTQFPKFACFKNIYKYVYINKKNLHSDFLPICLFNIFSRFVIFKKNVIFIPRVTFVILIKYIIYYILINYILCIPSLS